jgi:hypothetical protein
MSFSNPKALNGGDPANPKKLKPFVNSPALPGVLVKLQQLVLHQGPQELQRVERVALRLVLHQLTQFPKRLPLGRPPFLQPQTRGHQSRRVLQLERTQAHLQQRNVPFLEARHEAHERVALVDLHVAVRADEQQGQ